MRVAVVVWNMALGATSRGWYLADLLRTRHRVQLVGPLLASRRSCDIWLPVRGDRQVPMRAFGGHDLACYFEEARRFAATVIADVVYVSKPRFAGALLGDLIASRCRVPLVLDIDDEEQAFERPGDWLGRATPELAQEADAVTVVSESLQRRYGGTLVGQARDERVFDPSLFDRGATRAELGYGPEEFVILFVGAPRRHKGLIEIAEALGVIDDPRLRLCVIGSFTDLKFREELSAIEPQRVQLLDSRPLVDVPRLLSAGDLVCLAQDQTSAAARDQVPMKLTEAFAMGLPVLASETAGMAPFIEQGLVFSIGDAPLASRLAELVDEPDALRDHAARGRRHFLEQLSYRAIGRRLDDVLSVGAPPRSRPKFSATVALAHEQDPCPVGGPPGHRNDDQGVTRYLIRQLAAQAAADLGGALDGVSSCALVGYPNHRNPGDHAIWLGTKRILRDLEIEIEYECDWETYSRKSLARAVDAGATILFTGGGNFGDLWPNTQGLRERVLADFAGIRTVQLPQSIEFESDQNRERMRVLLEQHGNVELMVRDSESLKRAQRSFAVPTRLVPDLAFGLPRPKDMTEPAVPIVWVAPTDKESLGFDPPPGAADVQVCDWMPSPPRAQQKQDDLSPELAELMRRGRAMTRAAAAGQDVDVVALWKLWDTISRERLAQACKLLRRGRVVVTDRLHAHLMALHMGIPCVVSDNSYGKVRAFYDAYTCPMPLARWARSPAEALEIANELLTGDQRAPA